MLRKYDSDHCIHSIEASENPLQSEKLPSGAKTHSLIGVLAAWTNPCPIQISRKRQLLQCLQFDRKHRGKITDDWVPAIACIRRGIHLAATGAEINPALVERINRHGIAQHVHVTIFLRQSFCERLPLVSAASAAEDAQLAFVHKVFRVALDRDYVNRLRFM